MYTDENQPPFSSFQHQRPKIFSQVDGYPYQDVDPQPFRSHPLAPNIKDRNKKNGEWKDFDFCSSKFKPLEGSNIENTFLQAKEASRNFSKSVGSELNACQFTVLSSTNECGMSTKTRPLIEARKNTLPRKKKIVPQSKSTSFFEMSAKEEKEVEEEEAQVNMLYDESWALIQQNKSHYVTSLQTRFDIKTSPLKVPRNDVKRPYTNTLKNHNTSTSERQRYNFETNFNVDACNNKRSNRPTRCFEENRNENKSCYETEACGEECGQLQAFQNLPKNGSFANMLFSYHHPKLSSSSEAYLQPRKSHELIGAFRGSNSVHYLNEVNFHRDINTDYFKNGSKENSLKNSLLKKVFKKLQNSYGRHSRKLHSKNKSNKKEFLIPSCEKSDEPFKMKINGRIQAITVGEDQFEKGEIPSSSENFRKKINGVIKKFKAKGVHTNNEKNSKAHSFSSVFPRFEVMTNFIENMTAIRAQNQKIKRFYASLPTAAEFFGDDFVTNGKMKENSQQRSKSFKKITNYVGNLKLVRSSKNIACDRDEEVEEASEMFFPHQLDTDTWIWSSHLPQSTYVLERFDKSSNTTYKNLFFNDFNQDNLETCKGFYRPRLPLFFTKHVELNRLEVVLAHHLFHSWRMQQPSRQLCVWKPPSSSPHGLLELSALDLLKLFANSLPSKIPTKTATRNSIAETIEPSSTSAISVTISACNKAEVSNGKELISNIFFLKSKDTSRLCNAASKEEYVTWGEPTPPLPFTDPLHSYFHNTPKNFDCKHLERKRKMKESFAIKSRFYFEDLKKKMSYLSNKNLLFTRDRQQKRKRNSLKKSGNNQTTPRSGPKVLVSPRLTPRGNTSSQLRRTTTSSKFNEKCRSFGKKTKCKAEILKNHFNLIKHSSQEFFNRTLKLDSLKKRIQKNKHQKYFSQYQQDSFPQQIIVAPPQIQQLMQHTILTSHSNIASFPGLTQLDHELNRSILLARNEPISQEVGHEGTVEQMGGLRSEWSELSNEVRDCSSENQHRSMKPFIQPPMRSSLQSPIQQHLQEAVSIQSHPQQQQQQRPCKPPPPLNYKAVALNSVNNTTNSVETNKITNPKTKTSVNQDVITTKNTTTNTVTNTTTHTKNILPSSSSPTTATTILPSSPKDSVHNTKVHDADFGMHQL